jgi:hypothetical protein
VINFVIIFYHSLNHLFGHNSSRLELLSQLQGQDILL